MRANKTIWTIVAWSAGVLAMLAILAILVTFVMVPDNLALTLVDNIKGKFMWSRVFLIGFTVFTVLSLMASKKVRNFPN
jgi:hypothetical protein